MRYELESTFRSKGGSKQSTTVPIEGGFQTLALRTGRPPLADRPCEVFSSLAGRLLLHPLTFLFGCGRTNHPSFGLIMSGVMIEI